MRKKQSSKLKVRFHLAKGHNFMKWQIKNGTEVNYETPSDVSLVMFNVKLKNTRATAKKIHDGAFKTVCAWVECEDISVTSQVMCNRDEFSMVSYNPKRNPYWTDVSGKNVDNREFAIAFTDGRSIFVPNNQHEKSNRAN